KSEPRQQPRSQNQIPNSHDSWNRRLSAFFDSGPSLEVAYRPIDSWNPFSFVVKTGTRNFGSPISSPMVMSAEFNLIGNWNGNPSFMLHFKPRLGISIRPPPSSSFSIWSSLSFTAGVSCFKFWNQPP
ncbi:hypothetical protein LINPERPRIM_LOCUS21231, partial [Linum perenne]